jgi:hypothetical protein
VARRRLSEYFSDDVLPELYELTNDNPRTLGALLVRLWESRLRNGEQMSLSDINKNVEKYKKANIFPKKDEIDEENKFKSYIKPYWERVFTADTKETKGQTLEALLCVLFESLKGFNVIDKDVRTSSEEIDILIGNESTDPFLSKLGTPILVECKHWKFPVGAKDVNWFITKVKKRSLNVGILVAWKGITGNEYKDANLEIKRALEANVTIVILTKDQLMEVYSERDFSYLLKNCYYNPYKL